MSTRQSIAAIAAAAVMAGCAAPKIPAEQASNFLVCRVMYSANSPDAERRSAEIEARRRGLDCGPYLAAQQRQREADAASGALLMQQGAQMMRPPGVRCVSTPGVFGQVTTTCY